MQMSNDTNSDETIDVTKPLQSILDHVDEVTSDETADLKSIIESFGDRAFGPIMLLSGLFMLTPLGGIPMVPAAFGFVVITFAVQLLMRRDTPWMPNILTRVKVSSKRVKQVKLKAAPILAKIDGIIRPRMQWAARGPFQVLAALIAIILSVAMVPLGAVPFAVCIPGFVLGLLGLGITARDGVVMLIAFALSLGAFAGIWILLT
ncbi:MAG: exopolysaccharide biosynthesis protein [Litorimonas sp.]